MFFKTLFGGTFSGMHWKSLLEPPHSRRGMSSHYHFILFDVNVISSRHNSLNYSFYKIPLCAKYQSSAPSHRTRFRLPRQIKKVACCHGDEIFSTFLGTFLYNVKHSNEAHLREDTSPLAGGLIASLQYGRAISPAKTVQLIEVFPYLRNSRLRKE